MELKRDTAISVQRFEKICRDSGLVPKGRFETDAGVILIAEGYRGPNPDTMNAPHYECIWAVVHDEKGDVAQRMRINAFAHPFFEQRAKILRADAMKFLKLSKQVGRV